MPTPRPIFLVSLLAAFILAVQPASAATGPQKMEKMINLLDKLDREDLLEGLERANKCTDEHKFSCSDKELEAARKLINGNDDKSLWQMASSYRVAEQQRVQEEARQRELARQRVEELRRQEEAAERRQREREEAQERREQEARESAANQQAILAIVGSVAIAKATSGRNYSPEQRSQLIDSYVKDRANAANGVQSNNFEQKADSVKQDLDTAAAAAAAAQRRQAEQMRQAIAERRAAEARREASQAQAKSNQEARQATAAASERQQTQNLIVAQANLQADQKRKEQAAQQEQLRQQQERAQQQERLREQESNRQKKAKEKADKLAAEQAEKAAEQQAQKTYLATLVQGIRLAATKCPDGAGHYYATGNMPKVKAKEVVSCIDVSYEAICPGSRIVVTGVAKNFIGMSGCFGDTYQIDPKPACEVKDVQIRVTNVLPGCK